MKRLICLLTAVSGLYTHAQAETAPPHRISPRVVQCDVDYRGTDGGILIAEFGGGNGQVTCWDKDGHAYRRSVHVRMAGAGKFGACEKIGHIRTLGKGFRADGIFTTIYKSEAGIAAPGNGSYGHGVAVTVAGLPYNHSVSSSHYNYGCVSLADTEAMSVEPMDPYGGWQPTNTPMPKGRRTHNKDWVSNQDNPQPQQPTPVQPAPDPAPQPAPPALDPGPPPPPPAAVE